MKDAVERLNAEYKLKLSGEEIATIARQAEAAERLFQQLFEVEVAGVPPMLKTDPGEQK